jgi:predicted nucleic acid-binding protein
VLEIPLDTAAAYSEIRQTLKERATPIPSNDVWIAALARQHNLSILSTDPHFDRVPGIRRISW